MRGTFSARPLVEHGLAHLGIQVDRGRPELGVVEAEVGAAPAEQLVVVPCSTMRPCSITRMVSASRMVERRWAITKLVRCERSAAIASWISTSVRVSTELVASSRMRMRGSARNARAIVSSCFSPALTLCPRRR
jgi:hypothetical protein